MFGRGIIFGELDFSLIAVFSYRIIIVPIDFILRHSISEKNQNHGPCKMTGKAVFGHNLFSDLEPEEFQEQFLTGYRGPQVDEHKDRSSFVENASPRGVVRRYKSEEMEPPHSVSVHSSIQRKLDEHIEQDASAHGANYDDFKSKYYQYKKKYANDCDWYVHLYFGL
jgi:hypothetical protein